MLFYMDAHMHIYHYIGCIIYQIKGFGGIDISWVLFIYRLHLLSAYSALLESAGESLMNNESCTVPTAPSFPSQCGLFMLTLGIVGLLHQSDLACYPSLLIAIP